MPRDQLDSPVSQKWKRSAYIHSVCVDGVWLLFNLMSQQEVYASDEDIGLYTDILSDPNDSDLRQRNQEIFEELVRKKFLLSDEFDELRALSTNFKKKKAADGHLGLGIV